MSAFTAGDRTEFSFTGWVEMFGAGTVLTRKKPIEVLEWGFLMMTGIYLLCQCLHGSTFVLPVYSFPDRQVFTRVLFVTGALVLLKVDLSGGWTARIPILFAIFGICFLAYRTGRELFLLMLPIFMIGTADMDYHRIIKVYVAVVGSFLLITILCSFTGVIPNIVNIRDGHLRSSWGIAYPTDLASMVLFCVMMIWLSDNRVPDSIAAAGALLSFWVSFAVAESRTSAMCSLLLLFFIMLRMISGMIHTETGRMGKISQVFHLLLVCSFLLFAVLFFAALAIYARGGNTGYILNRLLSNRLAQTLEIYQDQGLHPFGCNYSPIGRGGSAIQPDTIYFIDSSYPLLLIRYGWLLFLTVAALWTGFAARANRAGDRKLLYVMTVIAFHALSEHHFPDAHYNILLCLPFARIPIQHGQTDEVHSLKRDASSRLFLTGLTLVIAFAAVCTAVPAMSRLRTVFEIWGIDSTHGEIRAIVWCGLSLTAVLGLFAALFIIAAAFSNRKKPSWKQMVLFSLCALLLTGIIWRDSAEIHRAEKNGGRISSEETDALRLMTASATGRVYVEDVPELVRHIVSGVDRAFWHGDDLARMKTASVVVQLKEDRQRFADKGFLFSQISPEAAVYSSDAAVISALTEAGYEWTDYDAAVRTVDLRRMAELNGLECTDEGSLFLEDGERLDHGPYLDLFQGSYVVSFVLKTDPVSVGQADTLCGLRITEAGSGTILAEKAVWPETSTENGVITADLSFRTQGSRYVQFQVLPENDAELEVLGIHYRKIQK